MLLGMLTIGLASADDVVLEGSMCDPAGSCSPYTLTLDDALTFVDSLGRTGTWSMTQERAGRRLHWVLPGALQGSILEGSQDCWVQAQSPLNPQLGSINVCLAGPELHVLRPYSKTCELAPLFTTGPAAGEDGHWAAGRLTPENASGMWIYQVRYYLNADSLDCAPFDHRVQVFLGDADQPPPATPSVIFEFNVDGASLGTADTHVDLALPAPVFVGGDQSLFVSMEQVLQGNEHTCPAVCITDPLVDDLSYWSNSATTPYPWADLASFNIRRLMISGRGIVAGP